MRILNRPIHIPDQAMTAILTAYMQSKVEADFDSIRNDVQLFSGLTDGAIHQHAIDAGYEVDTD